MLIFFFEWIGDHRELHRLTHSFPTRRSSDLSLQLQTGWLDEIGAVPDIAPDEASLAVNPKYALITVAIERARAGIAVATAAAVPDPTLRAGFRSEEHTSELQSLMRISYAVFCLKNTNTTHQRENKATG